MAKRPPNHAKALTHGATVGYEAELWRMAHARRGSVDAADETPVMARGAFLPPSANVSTTSLHHRQAKAASLDQATWKKLEARGFK